MKKAIAAEVAEEKSLDLKIVCLCGGFTAKSTQWGHVERGQFT